MSWNYQRMYCVYALATPSAAVQAWVRDVWRQVEQALLAVEQFCRGPIAVRGFGLRRTASNYHKEFRYGRLHWDQASSDKWTLEREVTGEMLPEIEFGGLGGLGTTLEQMSRRRWAPGLIHFRYEPVSCL